MPAVCEPVDSNSVRSDLRSDFPILDQQINGHSLIYFDNAASSQKPRAVVEAIQRYYEREHANVHRGVHELSNRATAAYEGAREKVAGFLGASSSNEIIFTRGTTEGLNLLATAWSGTFLKPGQKVLLSEMEHHSNMVPWQMACQRCEAELVYIPVVPETGELDLEAFEKLIKENVALMSVTHASNTLGSINPVKSMCELAKSQGVTTVVDAAQSAGHIPIDVVDMDCDFLAISGHKMLGPTGIGALYGRQAILEKMDPYQGGGEMISVVDYFSSEWNDVPHKFEAGTPNMAGAVGLAAAIDYLKLVGRQSIFDHDKALGAYAWERLSSIEGVRVLGPAEGRSGVTSFLMEGAHALDIVTLADQKGLALRGGHHCNQPLMKKLGVEATARASFYLYNSKEEIDRMIVILEGVRRMLA